MERSVEIKYWRHPWRTPLIFCLISIFVPALLIFSSYLDSVRLGYPFQLKPETAVVSAVIVAVILSYFLYSVSRSLKKVTVIGERVLLARHIGRTIAAGLREVEIRNEVLRVGKRFSVRLDGMVNKEQVKDLLAEHIGA